MPANLIKLRADSRALLKEAREHEHRLVSRLEAHVSVHGAGGVGEFNRKLAVWITSHVGTMWCAYLFAVIGVMGIVGAITNSVTLVLLVGAVSGYFLQLVLLPIIIVGQNVQAEATDKRAEADHETIDIVHRLLVQNTDLTQHVADLTDAVHKALVKT